MMRPDTKAAAELGNRPFPDDDWLKRFPLICSYLSDVLYDDGTFRKQSAISIKEQDGRVLASLVDHDLERGLYRVGSTVREALVAIEKALGSPGADWRPWKQQQKGGRK